ncbi:182 kDa tankyrase-1-binding protein [Pleurodeles waltl]|uniref:182 kDa tankyrase-1-binding protein n=1 Tax=Pleurodeles waltl TaxID=8319 RepID=UPI00370997EC
MASLAKPLPAPRRRPPEQTRDGNPVSTEQMESEETTNRPKPPIRPKPKVLPKPLSKSPSQEPGVVLPSSIPWSPKSPISEVPSAEKINLLTGPKPYGAAAGGGGIRRPSFTLKRQTSEPLSGDEACSSSLASVSKASVPLPSSPSPSATVPHQDTPSLVAQTEVDSVRREPVRNELPPPCPGVKGARPPVLKKPSVSFKVKPVLGAPKPSRFPGTTVDQILAKMEEDKGSVAAPGPEKGWAQRTSVSFDAGSRFGSTTYSSFRRSPSTTEGPREEGPVSPRAAGSPTSPLFQGTATLDTTDQSTGRVEVKASHQSDFPSDQSQKTRADSASTVMDHLKTTLSNTVPSEAPEVEGPSTSSIQNRTTEKMPAATPEPLAAFTSVPSNETSKEIPPSRIMPSDPWNEKLDHQQGAQTSVRTSLLDMEPVSNVSVREVPLMSEETSSSSLDPSRAVLANELTSSLLLGGAPLGSSGGLPLLKESNRASVETHLPSSLGTGVSSAAITDPAISSRPNMKSELSSSMLLGGTPLETTSSEHPTPKIISPREADGAVIGSPPKVESSSSLGGGSHFLGMASHQMEHFYPRDPGETPAMSQQSLGGMDWSLSESFEWNSPARRSDFALRRANLPASSTNEIAAAKQSPSDEAGVSAPLTGHALLGAPPHETRLYHEPGIDGSAELATVGEREESDLFRTSITAITDSGPKARLRKLPSEEAIDDTPEAIEFPKWERRQYSGEKARPSTPEKFEKVESSLETGMEMGRERDDSVVTVSEGLVEVGSLSGAPDVEETQEESNTQRLKFEVFQAEEVFEPHTGPTRLCQLEAEPDISHTGLASEVVDAQGLIEPLRPILLSDPAAEPCVLYHGLAPVEHATPSREDDSCLSMLEAKEEHHLEEKHFLKEEREPWCMVGTTEKSEAWEAVVTQARNLEVSDFDPMQSQLEAKKVLGAREPDSHWLEELLSPTPISEDLEQGLRETPKSQEYEPGLLGWSQKDLQSEFGTRGVEQLSLSKGVWEDQYGFGGTNQSQELDIGNSEWSRTHGIGEADWRREKETQSTDWSTKHNIGETSPSEPSGVSSTDWSVKHSLGEGDQSEESEIGTTGWASTHGMEEREPGVIGRDWLIKQSMEEGHQGEGHGMIGFEWAMKQNMEESDQGEEPRTSSREWYIRHSEGGTEQGVESGSDNMGWTMHPSVGETEQGAELVIDSKDLSIKPTLEDFSEQTESKISHVLSKTPIIGETGGRSSGDWSSKHSVGLTDQSEESEPRSMDWSVEHTLNDQSLESDARRRSSGDAYTVTLMEQHGDGVFRGMERDTYTGEVDMKENERDTDIGGIERHFDSREVGDGGTESRDAFEIRDPGIEWQVQGLEREMGDGEMERPQERDVGVVGRMADVHDVEVHRSYTPDGECSDLREAKSAWDSKNLEESAHEALHPEMPSSTLLEEMLGRGASWQPTPAERPASLQSSQSQESEGRPMDDATPAFEEKEEDSSVGGSLRISQPYLEKTQVQHEEGDMVEGRMLAEQERETPEEMEDAAADEVDFSFLEEAEILDSSVYRTRASLSRKRGHRAPTARPGAALNSTEVDGDEWMFQDSTDPKVPRPDSSEEEEEEAAAAATTTPREDARADQEDQQQKTSKKSPISLGKKMGIFAGFNPSAIKAKLKSRKAAEEGEQPKSPRQKDNFQRSKSCKLPSESGKPLVLPPKPEKPAGSESSSPQWLNALKLKKKPQK